VNAATPKSRTHLVERAVEAMGLGGARPLAKASPVPALPEAAARAAGPLVATAPGPLLDTAGVTGAPAAAAPAAPPPVAGPAASIAPSAAAPPAGAAAVSGDPVTIAAMQGAGLVALAASGGGRTRLSEELALVQQQVLRTIRGLAHEEGRATRVVLVTSARPGEGKTFTALNLAAAIATGGGAPTLLVDADGKRGSVSELLGRRGVLGLQALALQPELPVAPLLQPTAISRLDLVAYGTRPTGLSEEFNIAPPGTLLANAILRLAEAYPRHVLVVDSPPCLAASDPGSLAAIAGQVLVVVQAERTQRNEVEAALDMVEPCPTIQLVLNRTHLTTNDSFGAYGYGAYGAYGAAANPPQP
jgi:receptor protein-tyrosine kinase